jgi:multiple sugar transport system permease protein
MVLVAIAWLLPAVWVLVTSLKLTENIVRVPPEWIPWPVTIAHYGEVLFSSSRTARIGRAFFNSTVVSLGSVAVVVLTSAMAAYPLARMRFRGRSVIFGLLVGSLMIPNAVILVPQYVLVQRLGWLSTYQGLIVPEAAMTFAFGVFLLRQFFLTIPDEYLDAARVDGCGEFRILTTVVLRLAKPAIVAVALFSVLYTFNDFFLPLLYTGENASNWPVSVGLSQYRNLHQVQWNLTMAATLVVMAPVIILFFLAQKAFVEGVTLTGVKG